MKSMISRVKYIEIVLAAICILMLGGGIWAVVEISAVMTRLDVQRSDITNLQQIHYNKNGD